MSVQLRLVLTEHPPSKHDQEYCERTIEFVKQHYSNVIALLEIEKLNRKRTQLTLSEID